MPSHNRQKLRRILNACSAVGIVIACAAVWLTIARTPTTPPPALSAAAKLALDNQAAASAEAAERAATASEISSGCGISAAYEGKHWATAEDGSARTRRYLVQLPAGYDRYHAYPLIFVFHGSGSNASTAYGWGLQSTPAAVNQGIFVFPEGIPFQRFGVGWDDSKNGYDMAFFDHMTQAMESAFCVNTKRIYVAGFSWGGDFVTALICARGGTLRAAAVNSSTDEFRDAKDSNTYDNRPCPSKTHPAIRFEHAEGGDSQYPAPLFKTTSELFRGLNGCGAASVATTSSSAGRSCVSYNSCARPVVECSFPAGIGHALPPLWAENAWAFFDAHQ